MSKHYHICGNHRWACEKANCDLSRHAHCGFSKAGGFAVCLKKHGDLELPKSKFAVISDGFGYTITYRGKRIVRKGLTKAEQKEDTRHHSTVKKAARDNAFEAQTTVAALEDGNGAKKIWTKIRTIDRKLKNETADLTTV